ncbi:MAG: hypothetical protein K2N60_03540 [Oscillospiraceae bacterium]|nr:hypothetical protein [Oscillospiraceae bacterium]
MKKVLIFVVAFLMLAVLMPMRVYANSAEPPAMVILSVNAPSDTELIFTYSDGRTYAVEKNLRLWEKCYFLYYWDFVDNNNNDKVVYCTKVTVKSSEKSFELDLPDVVSGGSFSCVWTLDFDSEALTENVSPLRAPLYMLLRIMFTLIIECGFYYLVGYREKNSYIMFITVNLITQMFVNLVINGGSLDIFYSYTPLIYIGMELLVFIFEMIVLPAKVDEKKAGWTLLWTFTANTVSMVIGGIALLFVPF